MKNQAFFPAAIVAMATLALLGACNSEGNQTNSMDTAADSLTVQDYIDSTNMTISDMADDHYDFTYQYTEDNEMAESNNAAPPDGVAQKNTAPKTKAKMPRVKEMPVVYTVSQTDRPPLFSTDCLNDKKPERCSSRALAEWARASVVYPEADLAEGSDGLEYVTFVINKKGEVSSVNRVESKLEACEGCSKAVLDAVLKMPNWQPAMLNGKPVDVVVTLPVRFKTL
jgi:hypothetical protein